MLLCSLILLQKQFLFVRVIQVEVQRVWVALKRNVHDADAPIDPSRQLVIQAFVYKADWLMLHQWALQRHCAGSTKEREQRHRKVDPPVTFAATISTSACSTDPKTFSLCKNVQSSRQWQHNALHGFSTGNLQLLAQDRCTLRTHGSYWSCSITAGTDTQITGQRCHLSSSLPRDGLQHSGLRALCQSRRFRTIVLMILWRRHGEAWSIQWHAACNAKSQET